jgi:hypothetical protein
MRVAHRLLPIISGTLLLAWGWDADLFAPRPRTVAKTPIVWWSWRNDAPAASEVRGAFQRTEARTLFLRAGQFDYQQGQMQRIRAVTGKLPSGVELQLVYNATRPLLRNFEQIEPAQLAATVAESFQQDLARAAREGVTVADLQLDLDVPARLLPQYRQLLESVRNQTPPHTRLSVTGLQWWMDAPALAETLAAVDFWIPQFYGAEIPQRLEQLVPIASPQQTARAVKRARRLGKPFYAGLAASGYAALYSTEGKLLELRGDLDPALVASHPEMELSERSRFETAGADDIRSEWRLVYRARRECVLDGLVMRPGEALLLDVPSAANLRACAQAARAQGGASLLGLCVFRLPGAADPTTLTVAEIAAALAAAPTQPVAAITLRLNRQLVLEAVNLGAASAALGAGALTLSLRVPASSISESRRLASLSNGFSNVETACALPDESDEAARPCHPKRANVLRLSANHWRPGARLRAALASQGELPQALPVSIAVQLDDGRVWRQEQMVTISKGAHNETKR